MPGPSGRVAGTQTGSVAAADAAPLGGATPWHWRVWPGFRRRPWSHRIDREPELNTRSAWSPALDVHAAAMLCGVGGLGQPSAIRPRRRLPAAGHHPRRPRRACPPRRRACAGPLRREDRHRPDAFGHSPPADHRAGNGRAGLEIALGAGARDANHQPFRHHAAQRADHRAPEICRAVSVPILLGGREGDTERVPRRGRLAGDIGPPRGRWAWAFWKSV